MPADAWPGTVQRYAYLPAFANLTFSVAVFPGWMSAVFLPAILKSWARCPAFFTVNTTVPGLAIELFESLKKNSPAFTWTVDVAAPAVPTTPSAHTSARRTMTRFMDRPLLEDYDATVSIGTATARRSTRRSRHLPKAP